MVGLAAAPDNLETSTRVQATSPKPPKIMKLHIEEVVVSMVAWKHLISNLHSRNTEFDANVCLASSASGFAGATDSEYADK